MRRFWGETNGFCMVAGGLGWRRREEEGKRSSVLYDFPKGDSLERARFLLSIREMDNGGISAVETPHQHTRLITKSPLNRRAKQRKEKIVETALVKRLNKRLVRRMFVCLIHHPKLIMPQMAVNDDSYLRLGLTLIHKNPFARR
jgi:hypothetical protein